MHFHNSLLNRRCKDCYHSMSKGTEDPTRSRGLKVLDFVEKPLTSHSSTSVRYL